MFLKIFKILLLFIILFINGNKIFSEYIQKEYNILGEKYTFNFINDFQKSIFEEKQLLEINSFYDLLNLDGMSKYKYKYVIGGDKITNIFLKKDKIINDSNINGKTLSYFIKKYGGDLTNLSSTYFIDNIVEKNIPYNNYQNIALIKNQLKRKFNNLPEYNSSTDSENEQLLAENLYDFYKNQLHQIDLFYYNLINSLIKKINTNKQVYLVHNNYEGNKLKLNNDINKVNEILNSYYETSIITQYNNLFIENNKLNDEQKISQTSLNNIKNYFLAKKRVLGFNDIRFLDDISGILDNGSIFNYFYKTFYSQKILELKDGILEKIELLHRYETSSIGSLYTDVTKDIINNIANNDNNGITNSTILNGDDILDNINNIYTITSTDLGNLYLKRKDLYKKRKLDFINKNRSFLEGEKNFLQNILSGDNLNNILNSDNLIKNSDLLLGIEGDIEKKSLDNIINENINISYDINNDDPLDIYKKLYKKQIILNINNPILGSEFITPPISSVIIDSNIFKDSLKNNNTLFLKNYRTNFVIDNTNGMFENDRNLYSGLSNVSFSYTPSPLILKDNLGKNIGVQLGNKKSFYLNKSFKVDIDKGKYIINLYGINSNFNNVKLFFNGKSIDINGLLTINSGGGVNVSFTQGREQTNFLPTLWINSIIK